MPLISICSLYPIKIIKFTSSNVVLKYSFYLVYPTHLPFPCFPTFEHHLWNYLLSYSILYLSI